MKLSEKVVNFFEVVGSDNGIRCCEAFKHLGSVFIPKNLKTQNPTLDEMLSIIGVEKYKRVIDVFGGDSIIFTRNISNEIERDKIRLDYWIDNKDFKSLAKQYGRTVDNIRKIVKEKPVFLTNKKIIGI